MTSKFFSPIPKSQFIHLGSSKRTDMNSEKDDVNTIDIHQADELIIPLDNVLTRRSLFETDLDPDALKIEIYANEKLHGSLIFSSEDLQMLVKRNQYDIPSNKSSCLSRIYLLFTIQSSHLFLLSKIILLLNMFFDLINHRINCISCGSLVVHRLIRSMINIIK